MIYLIFLRLLGTEGDVKYTMKTESVFQNVRHPVIKMMT